MDNCLETLEQFHGWEDDLEIEALPGVQSATVVPALVFVPPFIHGPLTSVLPPTY